MLYPTLHGHAVLECSDIKIRKETFTDAIFCKNAKMPLEFHKFDFVSVLTKVSRILPFMCTAYHVFTIFVLECDHHASLCQYMVATIIVTKMLACI